MCRLLLSVYYWVIIDDDDGDGRYVRSFVVDSFVVSRIRGCLRVSCSI